MKKIIAILLILCLFLDITAYQIIFYFEQQQIKSGMKQQIRLRSYSEEETDFVIPVNDKARLQQFHWEGDDEFSLNGEMYDVIEKKTENNKLFIRSLSDKKETDLVKKYADVNKDSNSKSRSVLLSKLTSSTYIADLNADFSSEPSGQESKPSFLVLNISSCFHDVLTPPPQPI